MGDFKDRLWRELVREHGADLAKMRRPATSRSRRARPRVLVGTTLGLSGLGAALALALSVASSSPAFAVTPNHDGTVQVVIKRLSGISGANMKLASLGIRARVVQVVAGCKAIASSDTPKAEKAALLHATGVRYDRLPAPASAQVRLDPRTIPPGRILVLPTVVRAGHLIHIARAHWVRGAAPACLPPNIHSMIFRPSPSPSLGRGRGVECMAGPPPPGSSGKSATSGNGALPPAATHALRPAAIRNRAVRCRVIGPSPSGKDGKHRQHR